MDDIIQKIIDKKREMNVSNDWIADKSGIPEATVAKILNGTTKSSGTTAVAPIAAALGVSVGDEENGERPEDCDERYIALLLQNYETQTERLATNYEKQLRVKEIWIRALAAFLFVQIGVLLFFWRNL